MNPADGLGQQRRRGQHGDLLRLPLGGDRDGVRHDDFADLGSREPVEGRLEFAGRLEAAGPERLAISEADGQTAEVPRALVTKARLDPPFRRK